MGATVSVISEELARPVDAADVPSCVDPLKVSRLRRLLHVAFRDEGGYELDDAALTPQLAREVDELLTDCAAEPGLTRLANDKILRRLLRQQARELPIEASADSLENSALSASDGLSRSGNSDLGGALSDSMLDTSIGETSPKAPTFVQEPRLGSRQGPSLSVGSESRTSPSPSAADEVNSSPDHSLRSSNTGRSRSEGSQPRQRKSDIASMAKQHARSRHLRRREQKRKEQLAAAQQQDSNTSDPTLLRAEGKSSSINEDMQQGVDDDSDNLSLGSGTSSAYSYASTANSNPGSAAGAVGRRSSLSLGSYPVKQTKRRSVTFGGGGGGEPASGGSLSVSTNIVGSYDGNGGGTLATISSPSARPPRKPRPSLLEIEGGNSSGSASGSGEALNDFGESGWRGEISPLTAQSVGALLPAEQEKISLRRSSIASTTAAIAALERRESFMDESVSSTSVDLSSAPSANLTKAQLWRKSSMDNRMLRQMNSGYSGSSAVHDDEVPRAPPDRISSIDYREASSEGGGSTITETTVTLIGRPRPQDLALPTHDEWEERTPSFDQTPPQDKSVDPFGVSSDGGSLQKQASAAASLFSAVPTATASASAPASAPEVSATAAATSPAAPAPAPASEAVLAPPLSSAPSRPMAGRPRPMALKLAAEDDNNAEPLIMAPKPRVPQTSLLSLLDGDGNVQKSTTNGNVSNSSGNSSNSSGGSSSSNSSESEQQSLTLNTSLEKPRVGGGVTHRGSLRGLSNTTELNASLRDPSYDLTGDLSLSGGALGSTAYLSQSGTLEVQNFRISESGIVSTPTGSFGTLNRSGSGNLDSDRSNGSSSSNSSSVKSSGKSTGGSSSSGTNNIRKSSKSSRGSSSQTYAARPQLNRTSSAGGPRPFVELQRLGAGASGTVVKALHVASLALVAIKTLPIFDADKRHQMARELKLLYKWQRAIVGDAHGYDHDAATAAAASKSASKAVTATECPFAIVSASAPAVHGQEAKKNAEGMANADDARKADEKSSTDVDDDAPLPAAQTKPEAKDEVKGTEIVPVEAATAAVAAELSPSHRSRSNRFNSSSSSSKCGSSKKAKPTHCPHIVSFYDAFVTSEASSVSLVVEYMNGGSLQDLVEQGGCDDEAFLASVASGTLRALHFLHEQCKPPMLHRDIKPANILINTRGLCKIADFGIYHEMDPTGDGHARTFIGSLSFMSPERITGGEYSTPADIWAIGLTLMTVALGRCPVTDSGRGYWALLHELTDKPPPTLPPGDDRFSPTFRDFLSCMLCALPHERWPASRLLLHPFFAMHGFADAHAKDIATPASTPSTTSIAVTSCAATAGTAATAGAPEPPGGAAAEVKEFKTGAEAVVEAKVDSEAKSDAAGEVEAANETKMETTTKRIDSLDMGSDNGASSEELKTEAASRSKEAQIDEKPEPLSRSPGGGEVEEEPEGEEEEEDLEGGSLQGAELAQVVDALESVVRDYAVANPAAAAAAAANATASAAASSTANAAATAGSSSSAGNGGGGEATTANTGPKVLPLPPWLPVLTEKKLRGLAWQIDMPYNRVRAAIEARFNGTELPVLLEPLPVLPW